MNRRRFLLSTAFFALSGVLGIVVGGRVRMRTRPTPATLGNSGYRALIDLCRVPGRRSVIGVRYLAEHPEVTDGAALLEQLRAALPQVDGTHNSSALRSLVRQHVAKDFDTGDVVTVDGWLLARTEAALCALAALEER